MLSRNNIRKFAIYPLLVLLVSLCALTGCKSEEEKPDPDFSGAQEIAELSTFDCYYHNVAKLSQNSDWIFGLFGHGYKKMWIEYDGIVHMGIDASKVTISEPDANNVVTVAVPQAKILGMEDLDEDSLSEPLVETGFLTDISAEDKKSMLATAQSSMREQAENDDSLLAGAREQAKTILEQYVKSVGDTLGETYTVKFVDAE